MGLLKMQGLINKLENSKWPDIPQRPPRWTTEQKQTVTISYLIFFADVLTYYVLECCLMALNQYRIKHMSTLVGNFHVVHLCGSYDNSGKYCLVTVYT